MVRRGGLVLLQSIEKTQVIHLMKYSKGQKRQKNPSKSHGTFWMPNPHAAEVCGSLLRRGDQSLRTTSHSPCSHKCPTGRHPERRMVSNFYASRVTSPLGKFSVSPRRNSDIQSTPEPRYTSRRPKR